MIPLLVARKSFGPRTEIESSEARELGTGNLRIVFHRTQSGNKFVEKVKVGDGGLEARVNQAIMVIQGSGDHTPTPRVLDVTTLSNETRIFSDYSPSANWDSVSSREIVELILKLHDLLNQIESRHGPLLPDKRQDVLSKIRLNREALGVENFEVFKQLEKCVRPLDKVASHNDLSAFNVRMSSVSGDLIAIDFATVGFNFPGAELHSWIRKGAEATDHIFAEYQKSTQTWSTNELLAGGKIYATYRQILWAERRNRPPTETRANISKILRTDQADTNAP